MTKDTIDPDKVRQGFRRLPKEDLLTLLYRATDLLPRSRLATMIEGYMSPADLRPDTTIPFPLFDAIRKFEIESKRGKYYEDFAVDSKNFMQKSQGTVVWIAECNRYLAKCVSVATRTPDVECRNAFEILFGLLRHIDECLDDIIFFADEGGAWQVGVEWRSVLPAYFRCLAATALPEDYARAAVLAIEEFENFNRALHLKSARQAANPSQRKALRSVK